MLDIFRGMSSAFSKYAQSSFTFTSSSYAGGRSSVENSVERDSTEQFLKIGDGGFSATTGSS